MRIIAGKYKSRTVKFPNSKLVRPTTDKVKESIFNYLTNYIEFEDISACDIYAGSGSLGLEMLSRGAAKVHFVEKNFPVQKVLQENIASLGVEKQTKVFKLSAVSFSQLKEHEKYNLIIADPPFFQFDVHEMAKNIMENNFLTDDGIMLIERSIQTKKEDIEGFGIEPFRQLGDSLIYKFENEFDINLSENENEKSNIPGDI